MTAPTRAAPVLALGLLLASCGDDAGGGNAVGATTDASPEESSCGPVEELVEPAAPVHVVRPDAARYRYHPPTSGPHLAGVYEPGVQEEPMDEALQVFALEQGLVVLHHAETVDADDVAALAALAALAEDRRDVVVTEAAAPMDGGVPLAFTAWERRQRCERASTGAIEAAEAFVERFAGRGPDEHGE